MFLDYLPDVPLGLNLPVVSLGFLDFSSVVSLEFLDFLLVRIAGCSAGRSLGSLDNANLLVVLLSFCYRFAVILLSFSIAGRFAVHLWSL